MTVWRIKLNSGRTEEEGGAVNGDEAKEYCREAGLVGVGWGLSRLRRHSRLDRVLDAWREKNWPAGEQTISRLAKTAIEREELINFMESHPELLPPRIAPLASSVRVRSAAIRLSHTGPPRADERNSRIRK